jgi:hypothetical protein
MSLELIKPHIDAGDVIFHQLRLSIKAVVMGDQRPFDLAELAANVQALGGKVGVWHH